METVRIDAIDGKSVRAFVAQPSGKPSGCVVVVQEIFGVNDHIRWVLAEQYAKAGLLAIAPACFDRIEADVELGYSPETVARGRALVDQLGVDAPLRDIRAAQRQLAGDLPTGVVGYCWGGSIAYLAATRLGLPAVSYYGGRTAPYLHERLQAPLLAHFGQNDEAIPMDTVQKIRDAHPNAQCFVYAGAGHGFNRYGHPAWHAESATLALERSLAFLRQHLR